MYPKYIFYVEHDVRRINFMYNNSRKRQKKKKKKKKRAGLNVVVATPLNPDFSKQTGMWWIYILIKYLKNTHECTITQSHLGRVSES